MGRPRPSPARSRVPLHRRRPASPRSVGRWAVVAVLSISLAAFVAAAVGRAERDRARWGAGEPVLVTTRPVRAGEPLADAVEVRRWPVGLVPDGALSSPAEMPVGATAPDDRAAGEPVTSATVRAASDGVARPEIAVPTPGVRPQLTVGDRVSLWATYEPSLAAGRPTTRRIDDDATVTAVQDDAVVVAVDADEVGEVVEATALATVTVVSERR
ncbi:MAG: SAF domain-containing protein [Actinobacteria bacterium]|nr:SAF domain-containing protein [Actinomycetota bacterium]